jgi:hypothetical protein
MKVSVNIKTGKYSHTDTYENIGYIEKSYKKSKDNIQVTLYNKNDEEVQWFPYGVLTDDDITIED